TNSEIDHWPIWSPDGSQLAFDSGRGGYTLHAPYQKPSSGAVAEHLLFQPDPKIGYALQDWSLDGRFIVFYQGEATAATNEIWILPLYADRKPFPYLSTLSRKGNAAISPNGKWLAYVSNESGTNQVIVQPFPDPSGGRWQISGDGGQYPRWRRDGRELYYLDPKGRIVSVPVMTDTNFQYRKSTPLFQTPIPVGLQWNPGPAYPYDVSPDGQRFLISASLDFSKNSTPSFTVILNWPSALKR